MFRLFISVYSEKQSQNSHEGCSQKRVAKVRLKVNIKNIFFKNPKCFRLAVGQKRYSGQFMDGTAANNDPFDLRSVFHK